MRRGKTAHTFPVESYLERCVQGMNGAVPIGFLMALSQDMEAMERFGGAFSPRKGCATPAGAASAFPGGNGFHHSGNLNRPDGFWWWKKRRLLPSRFHERACDKGRSKEHAGRFPVYTGNQGGQIQRSKSAFANLHVVPFAVWRCLMKLLWRLFLEPMNILLLPKALWHRMECIFEQLQRKIMAGF